MKKFEYKMAIGSVLNVDILNVLGQERWELVGFISEVGGNVRYFLKREIIEHPYQLPQTDKTAANNNSTELLLG